MSVDWEEKAKKAREEMIFNTKDNIARMIRSVSIDNKTYPEYVEAVALLLAHTAYDNVPLDGLAYTLFHKIRVALIDLYCDEKRAHVYNSAPKKKKDAVKEEARRSGRLEAIKMCIDLVKETYER